MRYIGIARNITHSQSYMTEPVINVTGLDSKSLQKVLDENNIGLTASEAQKIARMLKRNPTLTEAVIWGIQGSEHSSYKSSKRHLRKLPTEAPNVILGPNEDSGIVEIARYKGVRYGLVMSHESHNHPSQIVPYEGAATGVGGIVRDIVCMGARAIATMDALRFGDCKNEKTRYIANEVVNGVAGYGNPLGVPNIGGDVCFSETYNDNCLVNVVAFGVLAEDEIIHSFAPDGAEEYDLIFVGKPTDRSGMGGASFASTGISDHDEEFNKGAVQEPNPFLERHLLAATYELFDILKEKKLINKVGFKDMGAGGNMCASVELADGGGYGAEVHLDDIHVAEDDLPAAVIACSETQERFCWTVPHNLTPMILKHYNEKWALPEIAYNARASHAGVITGDGMYRLYYNDELVCNAKATQITSGLLYSRPYKRPKKALIEPRTKVSRNAIKIKVGKEWKNLGNLEEVITRLITAPNIASRRNIYEQYDKTVQGMIHLQAGAGNAGVIAPLVDREELPKRIRNTGVAVSVDGNSRYGLISPYYQAVHAALESMRNVIAAGGNPQCFTDCLNYGNPEEPAQMWEFVEGIKALRDTAKSIRLKDQPKYPIPFISGNVSFYNHAKDGESIAPSAIVACAGTMPDYKSAMTPGFKEEQSTLLLIGRRKDECGGSEYYKLADILGANVPIPKFKQVQRQMWTVHDLIEDNLVLSVHDISEGGLAVTLMEMAFASKKQYGFEINCKKLLRKLPLDKQLFSETPGFVLEVADRDLADVVSVLKSNKVEVMNIGITTNEYTAQFKKGRKKILATFDLSKSRKQYNNALRTFLH